jgi:hypothetical protein
MRIRQAFVFLMLGLLGVSAQAGVSHRVVLLTNTPIPGTEPGTTVSFFVGGPSFSNSGDLIIRSRFAGSGVTIGNDSGLVHIDPAGVPRLIVREGDNTPPIGIFNGTFKSFELQFVPILRDNGMFGFYSTVTIQNTDIATIWLGDQNGIELLASEILDADGFEFDTTWNPFYVDFYHIALNNAGTATFLGGIFPAPQNLNSVGTGNWLRSTNGTISLLLATGMAPPPGQTLGEKFISFSKTALRDDGTFAYLGTIANLDFNTFIDEGLYIHNPDGSFQDIIYLGVQPDNVSTGESIIKFFAWPVYGSAGSLGVLTQLKNIDADPTSDVAIVVDRGTGLRVVIRETDQAPGLSPGIGMVGFDLPMGDIDVSAPFRAGLIGPGVSTQNNNALFRLLPDDKIQLIVRSGDKLPKTAPGETVLTIAILPAGNKLGQIVFRADLDGPGIDPITRMAYWATDTRGVIHKIARAGEPFVVAPGDVRIVSSIEAVLGSGGNSGGVMAFNDHGELAYKLSFSDGSQAIVVSTITADPSVDLTGDALVDAQDLGIMLGQWGFCPVRCEADLNNDGHVNGADMGLLLSGWDGCGVRCLADFNSDGVVDGSDLGFMLGQWGCTSGCTADLNGDGAISGADLGLLLSSWG